MDSRTLKPKIAGSIHGCGWTENHTIPNSDGSTLIPSCFVFTDNGVLVGKAAKKLKVVTPGIAQHGQRNQTYHGPLL